MRHSGKNSFKNPSVATTQFQGEHGGLRFCKDELDLRFKVRFGARICAFAVDRQELFRETIRVTRSGGLVMFSSYTPQFCIDWNGLKFSRHTT
ncbi:MAG: hypothetical protein DMG76_30275 [Acidobacteria bacterium]|nr:MAG: hypothetical protein DMG76_30275 [Acidobacteriota bacterium]